MQCDALLFPLLSFNPGLATRTFDGIAKYTGIAESVGSLGTL